MRFGVVVFPGTNCDRETIYVLRDVIGASAEPIWHQDTDLSSFDCLLLPGGFAHGDYLRAGAIARFSPVMATVEEFARTGRLVVGICNGMQVLLEAGLLPGAMLPNAGGTLVCEWVYVRVERADTPFTSTCRVGQLLRLPIAHGEGRYFAAPKELEAIERRGLVALRYCAPDGSADPDSNPNGATHAIAGLVNQSGNVFGLMPHPERASEAALGGTDGRILFESLLRSLAYVGSC